MRAKALCSIRFITLLTLLLTTVSFTTACTTLNTRDDYAASTRDLQQDYSQPGKAVADLPVNEIGTFINLMERTYLSLLAGNPDIDDLIKYSHKIDNQVRYKVSKEIKSLFYVETPEGYYASEHEIIWMHLLLSWGFSIRKDFENATVEAKIASHLLQSEWSPEGRFDDPFIRIMLGSLWAMTGDWENARVDFRAAYKLDSKLKWAMNLANMDKKPDKLIVILGGTGPESRWNPDSDRSGIRGYRDIVFDPSGKKSRLLIKSGNGSAREMQITPDSAKWYIRHFERNNAINEVIADTKYVQKAVATGVEGTVIISAGVLAGVAIMGGGVGLSAIIIYIAIEGNSAELFGAGLLIAAGGFKWGASVISDSADTAAKEAKSNLDESNSYRFVRFLPEYAWLNWNTGPKSSTFQLFKDINEEPVLEVDFDSKAINGVFIGFYPDCY